MTKKPRAIGPPAATTRRGPWPWLRCGDESAVHGEEGNTLVEVLMTLIVMSLACVALTTGFATTIIGSAEHRTLATFDTIVVATSQQAITEIQQQPALFTTCPANAVTYYQSAVPLTVAAPNTGSYTAAISAVQYWNGTAFTTTCVKSQPQQITVTVIRTISGSGPVSYSNTFDVTYPMAPTAIVSGAAASLAFTAQPGGGSGGIALSPQPQVTIEDANGIPVSNDLSPVVLSVTNNAGTIVGCSGSENNGVVTFQGCAVTTAGTYTLTASDANLPNAISTSFVVGAAPPSLVFVAPQPVAGLSGSTLATQPTIEVETSGGVLVSSSTATISLTSSSGVLTGCTSLTAVGGYIHPTGCAFAGLVGTFYTLNATSAGLVPGSSNSITPSGPGPATQILFTTQPSGVAAAAATTPFTTQPVVTAEDSAGNVATTYATSVTVTANTGNVVTCTSNSVAPSSGVAAFAGCHNGAYANGVTLTAASAALTVTSAPFNVTGVATKLAFTVQPVAGNSGTSLTTQPVLQVEDSNGNVVTSQGASVTLTTSGGILSQCAGLGTTTGVVNVASCLFAGLVGTNYTMTAASNGLTSAVSSTFSTTGAGAETQLVFTTQPITGASQNPLTVQPVVKVEDSGGNVETTSVDTITLTSSGGTLAGCTNLTATAGVVNVQNCTFAGSTIGIYTLQAIAGSLIPATSTSFTPTAPGPASQILLTGCASGINWQATCVLTASVADEYNNTITSFVGAITFVQSGGTGTVSGLTSVTAVSGAASDTLTGTAVGTPLITASVATPSLTSSALSVPVLPIAQTITWTPPGPQTWVGGGAGTFSLGTASDSAVTTVTFASSTTSVCTVSGTLVTMVTAGTCTITPTATAGGNYAATTGSPSNITINKATQTITWTPPGSQTWVGGGAGTFSLGTASDSAVTTVTFASSTTSVCTVSGTTVTMVTAGTCTITPTATAGGSYAATTGSPSNITINKATQTITWTPPGSQTWGSGSVTLGASGPLGGTSASFSGTAGSSIYTSNTFNNPSSFSTSFWFKTTTPGAIAGATNQQSRVGAGNWDRQLWIDSSGQLVFGLYSSNVSGSFSEVISPGVYDNGTWHQVVATYGPAGEDLYVDGALVVSSAAGISGQNYAFYWHLGFAQTTSWPNGSVSQYFNGSLAQAALFTSQLTPTQVSTLYGAATTSAESTLILADSAVSYWPLTNAVGTTVFPDQSSGNANTGYIEGVFSLGTATDSAGTTVTFASSTPSVCTVNGTMVTELTAGTCTITPTAPASGSYAATTGSPSNITINP